MGQHHSLLLKLYSLSGGEAIEIPVEGGKGVDIRRKPSGEGGLLDSN